MHHHDVLLYFRIIHILQYFGYVNYVPLDIFVIKDKTTHCQDHVYNRLYNKIIIH